MTAEAATAAPQPGAAKSPLRWHVPTAAPAQQAQQPRAWAIYEALHDPIADQARREWLNLRDGELPPRVLQAVFPSLVIWASLWPDRPRRPDQGSTSRTSV